MVGCKLMSNILARKVVKRSDLPKGVSFDSQEFADYLNMNINQGLTVVGLLGLVDPPKVDIPSTVATLRNAYIRVSLLRNIRYPPLHLH